MLLMGSWDSVKMSLHIQLQQLHKYVVTSVNQFSNTYPGPDIVAGAAFKLSEEVLSEVVWLATARTAADTIFTIPE